MIQYFVRREAGVSFVNGKKPELAYVCRVDVVHGHMPRAMHLHEDRVEVVIILEGSGSYNIDNERYLACRGDIVVFNNGVLHDETAGENDNIATCCFAVQGVELKGYKKNELLAEDICPVIHLAADFPLVERMFRLLVDVVQQQVSTEIIDHITQALLIKLVDCGKKHGTTREMPVYSLGLRIKAYIDANYCEPLSLREMAKVLNINSYYLAHEFKEKVGYSPMQYIIRRRIGEAQNLLINTSKSITEIAMHCGYNNSNYFQLVFNSIVGMSPGRYRKLWVKATTTDKI